MLFNGLLEGCVPPGVAHWRSRGDGHFGPGRSHAHHHDTNTFLLPLGTVLHYTMPRENSVSDIDGESLTSDEEVGVTEVPVRSRSPQPRASASQDRPQFHSNKTQKSTGSIRSSASRSRIPPVATIPQLTPKDRFRASVRKIIALSRTTAIIRSGGLGAEPGVDPRRHSAFVAFGNIRQKCIIDIIDYSAVRCSFGRMTNGEFVQLLRNREASAPEPWVKVRWINIGGISWDVISALALKYGNTRLHDL